MLPLAMCILLVVRAGYSAMAIALVVGDVIPQQGNEGEVQSAYARRGTTIVVYLLGACLGGIVLGQFQ